MFLSPIIPAFFMLKLGYESTYLRIYTPIEVALIILTIFNLIFIILILFKKDKKLFTAINKNERDNISIFIFIVSSFVVIATIYSIVKLHIPFKIDLVTFCLLIFAALVIFDKVISNFTDDTFSKDLENLEYEIYLKNLKDNEIRHILQSKYMGFLVEDWIKFKLDEINKKLKSFSEEDSKIKLQEMELRNLDKAEYPIEFDGREKKIKKLRTNLRNRALDYYETNHDEIKEIVDTDPTIELEHSEKLKSLLDLLKSNLKSAEYLKHS
ncbi:hypothetical protein D2V08_00120 [Flagellimonas lutimaris]|uniref:Uncharacterized protein n=2 Tax=Flagellimonas lutimaris TaxID=475082 RepID=A0A3A1NEJ8_9FLAO|nr:hypothetical protein D2V08_00120 [Allomuricauda lutimaris]